ncbi:unnamed protein product [Calypogeia fissa]
MAKAGHRDHKWWLETWDEGEHPVAKLWCHECKKWQGNGKVDQYSNTCSNFMRQHVPTTLHMKEYHRRVGKEAVMLEQARQLAGQDQPNDKQLIDEAVGIIKAANDKGDECFVIQGDLTNLRLSPAAYKWKCKYCRVLHNLCPRTNNLAWSLELHLNGDRHIQKRAEAEKMLAGHQPFSSGRVGRPLWQVSVADDEKQQRIKSFFHPTPSSASNTAGSSGVSSSSKGTYNALLVCWGLWRSQAIVEGRKIHIKPFLLDQQRGSNWYSEPFLAAEIEYNDRTLLVDGCFRHVACMRISTDSDGFQDFTCDKCHSIIQEKDFKMRVFREEKAAIKRGDRDTGRGRRIDFLRTDEAKLLIKQKNAKARRLERELWVLQARLLRQKASRKSFIMVQEELANREDITNFCRRIVNSWRDGLWGGKEALWDFMSDVSKNLSRKANGRRYSKNTKVTWEVVKLRAGPVISKFLTRNLQGPSLSTTKRDIKKEFHYIAGESAVQFRHIGKTYGKLKEQLGITGPVPFIIAEDETSVPKMIRWVSTTDTLMGFCGTKADHKCMHNFTVVVGDGEDGYNWIVDAFERNVKANYARVLMANPLHSGLPSLLIVAMCTCNTFDAGDIRMQWNRIEKLWKENCHEVGPIIGHASDGDSRRRAVQLHDYCCRATTPAREFRIDWEGFALGALIGQDGDVSGLHDQDWIHNVKKLISPLDSSCQTLWLGSYIV